MQNSTSRERKMREKSHDKSKTRKALLGHCRSVIIAISVVVCTGPRRIRSVRGPVCTCVSHACHRRAFVKLPLSRTVPLTCHFRRWSHVKARRTPSFGDCQTDGSQLGFIPTESDTMTCYCMTLCMLPSALASAGSLTLAHNTKHLPSMTACT